MSQSNVAVQLAFFLHTSKCRSTEQALASVRSAAFLHMLLCMMLQPLVDALVAQSHKLLWGSKLAWANMHYAGGLIVWLYAMHA